MNVYPLFASNLIETKFDDEESIKKLNQICEGVEWSTNETEGSDGSRASKNKYVLEDYEEILMYFPEAIITLHGWLRIMPKEVCERFSIFNGHPGLITEYPELKGKDPQIRAFEGKYPVMGCVIHKVTAGVDEGKILKEIRFNAWNIKEEEMWKVFRCYDNDDDGEISEKNLRECAEVLEMENEMTPENINQMI